MNMSASSANVQIGIVVPSVDTAVKNFMTVELQATDFELFRTRNVLGTNCEFAAGQPLQPDEAIMLCRR